MMEYRMKPVRSICLAELAKQRKAESETKSATVPRHRTQTDHWRSALRYTTRHSQRL